MISLLTNVVLAALLIFLSGGLFAQHGGTSEPVNMRIRFENYTTEDGLSNNSVRCILQDRRGFIWFGTSDGLNRYDGREFKIFRQNPEDSKSIGDNQIKCLFQDTSGKLWIGTKAGGLYSYNASMENFNKWGEEVEYSGSISANGITALCEDKEGFLWIGTSGGGLNSFEPETGELVHYQHRTRDTSSLSNDYIRALYCDVQGNLWVGTDSGLDLFDPERKIFIRQNIQQPKNNRSGSAVGIISGDKDGLLWIGAPYGLVQFNPSTGGSRIWQPVSNSPKTYEENRITAIEAGTHQNLWIGTFSNGLYLFNKKTFKPTPIAENTESVLSGGVSVFSIYRDKADIVWVGTFNGIYKILPHGSNFRDWTQEIGASKFTGAYTWPIFEDRNGVIWIGTISGLNSYDPATGKVTQYVYNPDNPGSLSNNAVISIFEDSHGELWIGTFTGGLNRFHRKTSTFEHWQYDPNDPQSLPHNLVGCIYEDRSRTLWIGTAKGLAIFDRSKNQPLRFAGNDPNSILQDQYILDLLEDREGNFWITTTEGGLFNLVRLRGTTTQWLHDPENPYSISANNVSDIIELPDPENPSKFYLWLGTEGGGINKFDPRTGNFRSFKVENGLADNIVTSMVVDEEGNLWISSEKGLSRFDPGTETFRTFDERDGIPNAHFNPWAALKSRSGIFYFGTPTGIIYFDPRDFDQKEMNSPFPVVFTCLEVYNKPVKIGLDSPLKNSITEAEEIRLSYHDNIFSLKFAALDFTKPDQILYAYKMEGFYDEWIEIGNRHRVDFTGLGAGEYLFRVKATNSRGVWNEDGAQLRIVITPPYWQTWWFRFFVLSVVTALLYAFYRMRLQRLLEVERTRTRIARDLHDDVSATLSGISWFAQAADSEKKAGRETQDFNRKIIESAADAQEKIKDIIWAIQPEHDKWEQLFAHCQRFAADLLESNQIKPEMHFQPPPGSRNVDMETRQNFWLMFKEILTNIVKHSRSKSVQIRLSAEKGMIHLAVSDIGVGFEPSKVAAGNGLKNIRARAENLGAEYRLHSQPGTGTRWEIRFPMK